MQALLDAVVAATREAGDAILAVRATGSLAVRHKDDGPVTAADLAANDVLHARLMSLRPDTGWFSEESSQSDRLEKRFVWVVDPLDGTQQFIQGTADFGVSVALIEGAEPVLGVVHIPVTDVTWWALRGGGTWKSVSRQAAHRVRVSSAQRVARMAVRPSDVRRSWVSSFRAALGDVTLCAFGSTVCKLVSVAGGETDACVSLTARPYLWDICACDVILREAGGVLTDLDGHSCAYDAPDARAATGLFAAPAALHRDLLRVAQNVVREVHGRI